MRMCDRVFVLINIFISTLAEKNHVKIRDENFAELYEAGVQAYDEEDWYQCELQMVDALSDYKFYKQTIIDCRLQCKKNTSIRELTPEMIEFSVFEKFIENSDCVRRCKQNILGDKKFPHPSSVIFETFRTRKPYEYLQFCWYQVGKMEKAASAAYTFYLANPHHNDMIRNVRYFKDTLGVKESDFLDLEMRPYKESYIRGIMEYNQESWERVRDLMEKAVSQYLEDEERCRADCESTYDHVGPQEFVNAVADHYISVLKCQFKCEDQLSVVFTDKIDFFVADLFHYLQFTYFKLNNKAKVAEAVDTFIRLNPQDDMMLNNKAYYINRGFDKTMFKPRPNIVEYIERREQIERLLNFVKENYMRDEREKDVHDEEENTYEHYMKPYERIGLKIVAMAEKLKGPLRFATDGFIKEEQCSELISLTDDISPDDKGAVIVGVKDAREKMENFGDEHEIAVRLFLRISETMRHYSMRYYNLTRLFFKQSAIVCWTHTEDKTDHNCFRQEDGSCVQEFQSVIGEEEYMVTLYLSDVEEGGELNFLDPQKTLQSSLDVQCGRLAGFQNGDRHYIEVPNNEKRCGLVIVFTTDPSKDEVAYVETLKFLHQLEQDKIDQIFDDNKNILEEFEKRGVKVIKNSSELNGERFVVDNLATQEECDTLENLVLEFGEAGSGYKGELRPLSAHEGFHGLTIENAQKLAFSELVPATSVQLFLDLSEKVRLYVEKYFNLSRPLYFDYTHLVCRTALDETAERTDLSHPVHSDNCNLLPNGTCSKAYPAYIHRDYSALLYLNGDIDGGEFFFAFSNKTEQMSIKPKCGRVVGFNAGEFHGVKALRRGHRCALALWFTHNPQYKELAHLQAKKIIARKRKAEMKIKHSDEL
ncbi:prolyl 3-hydroxylase 2-like isoform X2 [Gigantopelta aegis]|uniref:prolyl 3-hydroxylase 2-like isoform X2 n=1 Tax=Gigantopelta aegis TaxID=1735272 RepID=UPI001B888425|nr:prolyl 3-hydroxylase 2-like isoform X2 [Gigantopelta aegis]